MKASSTKYYSDETIQKYREHSDPDLYPDVDWFDALFDDMAENQRVNLSITGGGDIVKYYVSGSFYNESFYLQKCRKHIWIRFIY